MRSKRLSALLIAFALALAFSPVSSSDTQYDAVVEATGDDTANCERPDLPGVFVTQDVCNVQAAVNANPGGKILLRGAFHFAEYGDDGYVVPGTDGTVFITNDAEIRGDRHGRHYDTTIRGGYSNFSIGLEPVSWAYDFLLDIVLSMPDQAVPVAATIRDIEFENSYFAPIWIAATTGASVTGNKMTDGRSLSMEGVYGPGAHAAGEGILAGPPGCFLGSYPHLISGDIEIAENYVDGRYRRADASDPWAVPSYGVLTRGLAHNGIFLVQYVADAAVRDNEVHNMGIEGILLGGNDGTNLVSGNKVELGAGDSAIRPFSDGIVADGWYFYDGVDTAKYVIWDNDIEVGDNPDAHGIWLGATANNAIVRDNRIHVQSESGSGITLDTTSNADVSGNRITGKGQTGIAIYEYPDLGIVADSNTIRETRIEGFKALEADYYLGEGVTNNTLYVTKKSIVQDDSGNDTNTVIRAD